MDKEFLSGLECLFDLNWVMNGIYDCCIRWRSERKLRLRRQFDESIEAIDPLETMPPAKKSMVIFFLVDT